METEQVMATAQSYWTTAVDYAQTVLPQLGPEYLMLIMAVLIWLQLGRIARALGQTGGLPKDLPRRVNSLQQQVASMSSEIADFQHYAAQRRQPGGSGPTASYREAG